MSRKSMAVVLVHGWSVRNTETYGALPERLKKEARRAGGPDLDVHNIWLSKYISFHNEVRVIDIARALEAALRDEFGDDLGKRPLAMITHSTGGPVVREWLQRHYLDEQRRVPLSHFIMLAPANFGSALAQLGRTRLARLKAWFEGVEPGLGVLDWLELGSPESLALNASWRSDWQRLRQQGLYSFVLTGASIDHHAYDHVNSYTGEMDSDGVVRTAAANLNHRYVRVEQAKSDGHAQKFLPLAITQEETLAGVPFRILPGIAHSGDDMGILRSVGAGNDPHPALEGIIDCLKVDSAADYRKLEKRFATLSDEVVTRQKVELRDLPGPFDRTIIKDAGAQLIVRVRDDAGEIVKDFELMLTAGDDNPDRLPPGFHVDRQRNSRERTTLTFYLNASRVLGDAAIEHNGEIIRKALPCCEGLGLRVVAYPLDGFVHYRPAVLPVSEEFLHKVVRPHATTVLDIVLHRVVHSNVFRLTRRHEKKDFTRVDPGPPLGDE